MPKTYYKKVKPAKPRNPVFSNMVQREKAAKRRHQHEMFQAKLLRKEIKNEDNH